MKFFACNRISPIVKLTLEKVKGIKGMQQRLVSFLAAGVILAAIGATLDLPLGGLGGTAKAEPPRTFANVAILMPDAPNIAYLDPDIKPIELVSIIPGVPERSERGELKQKRVVAVKPVRAKKPAPAPVAPIGELFESEIAQAPAPLFPVLTPPTDEYFEEEPLSPPAPIDDNPFGVLMAETLPEPKKFLERPNKIEFSSPEFAQKVQDNAARRDINFDARRVREQQGAAQNPFAQTLSSVRPAPAAIKTPAPAPVNNKSERDLSQLAPRELRREFERTFIAENQFLSPMETPSAAAPTARPNGTKAAKEVAELSSGPMMAGGREVLQMRLEFGPDSAAVTSESVNIIRSFSQVATSNPSSAIEISISDKVLEDENLRRLAARRFAIVSNIMRGAGVAERQILPRLAQREGDSFVFSVVDAEIFTATVTGQTDSFGDEVTRTRSFNLRRW